MSCAVKLLERLGGHWVLREWRRHRVLVNNPETGSRALFDKTGHFRVALRPIPQCRFVVGPAGIENPPGSSAPG